MEVLESVPHIGFAEARHILYAHSQLLKYDPKGAASRMTHMFGLLSTKAALTSQEFSDLLLSHPNLIIFQVEQVSAALDWYKYTFTFSVAEIGKMVKCRPDLIAYTVEVLQQRVELLLDWGLSMQDVRARIQHHPQLLVIARRATVIKLEVLCTFFSSSRHYILKHASPTLELKPERLVLRGEFLQYLQVKHLTIRGVWGKRSDSSFAEGKIRACVKRTSK